jgi:hypothetical protein
MNMIEKLLVKKSRNNKKELVDHGIRAFLSVARGPEKFLYYVAFGLGSSFGWSNRVGNYCGDIVTIEIHAWEQ